jgi:hypothetical protein
LLSVPPPLGGGRAGAKAHARWLLAWCLLTERAASVRLPPLNRADSAAGGRALAACLVFSLSERQVCVAAAAELSRFGSWRPRAGCLLGLLTERAASVRLPPLNRADSAAGGRALAACLVFSLSERQVCVAAAAELSRFGSWRPLGLLA